MTKRRIGYLVSQYPAVTHTFILREIRSLRKLGWTVEAVSVRPSDRGREHLSAEEREEFDQTHTILQVGWAPVLVQALGIVLRRPRLFWRGLWEALALAWADRRRWIPYLGYFLEALAAGEYFRAKNIRHAHTHFASTVTHLMAGMYGIDYSLTIHGPEEFNDTTGFHLAAKVARAGMVAAISHYAASQVMRIAAPEHWEKVEVLRLGVDPETFTPRPAPDHGGGEPYELLMVGRLVPVKGHFILIDVLELLRERGLPVRLTLVGEGPLREALEQRIRERGLIHVVKLTGALNQEELLNHYRKADFFVLASFAEGLPVVLMEAMAMEVPCVATWVMGIPELVRDPLGGLLVAPADPNGLAGRLESLIADRQLRQRLGHTGRETVKQTYNLKQNVEKLADAFARHGIGA